MMKQFMAIGGLIFLPIYGVIYDHPTAETQRNKQKKFGKSLKIILRRGGVFLGSGDQYKSSLKNVDIVFGSNMYYCYIYKLYVKYDAIK